MRGVENVILIPGLSHISAKFNDSNPKVVQVQCKRFISAALIEPLTRTIPSENKHSRWHSWSDNSCSSHHRHSACLDLLIGRVLGSTGIWSKSNNGRLFSGRKIVLYRIALGACHHVHTGLGYLLSAECSTRCCCKYDMGGGGGVIVLKDLPADTLTDQHLYTPSVLLIKSMCHFL